MQISMTGRTGFITGGSDGMGRAMALKFAGASALVAIAARRLTGEYRWPKRR